MKRFQLQQKHAWWFSRSLSHRQHGWRRFEQLECTRLDLQAHRRISGDINRHGRYVARLIAPVAKVSSMLFKEVFGVPTSIGLASNSPNVSFLRLAATIPTRSDVLRRADIMAKSTMRVAAARTRRPLHTSSRKDAISAQPAPSKSSLTPISALESSTPARKKAASLDPEIDEEVPADAQEAQEALSRPPPVNSEYLPLPWKGRLGYACLCTYLRYANPPVFSSRTCRIASIIDNRHPLKYPSQPYHPTKNRPDRDQPADHARGQAYVEALGLANARDIVKMLRWNDRYGIKFLRLSSEMFPFASHEIYGYKLAPFASEVLGDAGRVAAELGHRLTMHPGQFTQLGSPRKEVIENSIRDLEFHSELLQLLELPPQQNRDAVMILHMGGVFGDKAATLDRFRENYKGLSQDIKNRLVLENDDVSWSVHDLLPICEELNIPLVLDFHHHNIIFDSEKLREGTLDIIQLFDRIRATWMRKNITQKMHYSEPEPEAITPRQRRKHNPRVYTLPPCDPTMDLMIEAKDKEQAVFELMRKYQLPGYERIGEIVPHAREDENTPWKPPRKTKKCGDYIDLSQLTPPPPSIPPGEVNMGGPGNRVYWPPGHEEWLRPRKRMVSRKPTLIDGLGDNNDDGISRGNTASRSSANNASPKSKFKYKLTAKKTSTAAASRAQKRKLSESNIDTMSPDEKDLQSSSPLSSNLPPTRSMKNSTPVHRSRRAKTVIYAEDDCA